MHYDIIYFIGKNKIGPDNLSKLQNLRQKSNASQNWLLREVIPIGASNFT